MKSDFYIFDFVLIQRMLMMRLDHWGLSGRPLLRGDTISIATKSKMLKSDFILFLRSYYKFHRSNLETVLRQVERRMCSQKGIIVQSSTCEWVGPFLCTGTCHRNVLSSVSTSLTHSAAPQPTKNTILRSTGLADRLVPAPPPLVHPKICP